jgi:hypothetical protein
MFPGSIALCCGQCKCKGKITDRREMPFILGRKNRALFGFELSGL